MAPARRAICGHGTGRAPWGRSQCLPAQAHPPRGGADPSSQRCQPPAPQVHSWGGGLSSSGTGSPACEQQWGAQWTAPFSAPTPPCPPQASQAPSPDSPEGGRAGAGSFPPKTLPALRGLGAKGTERAGPGDGRDRRGQGHRAGSLAVPGLRPRARRHHGLSCAASGITGGLSAAPGPPHQPRAQAAGVCSPGGSGQRGGRSGRGRRACGGDSPAPDAMAQLPAR